MSRIVLHSPASSANLGPGFDALGVCLDLENKIEACSSTSLNVKFTGIYTNNLTKRFKNPFLDIFYLEYKRIAGKEDNFSFIFHNKIPLKKGVGSSAAFIVAAVLLAYKLANVKITKDELLSRAFIYEGHCDNISSVVYGGFTVCILEGANVFVQQKSIPSFLKAILVMPPQNLSTTKSRENLPKKIDISKAIYSISRSSFLTASFFNEDWKMLRLASKDRLHQNYRMRNIKDAFLISKMALDSGALLSTLSGSGPSIFNMAHENNALLISKKLKEAFPLCKVSILNFNNKGIRVSAYNL